MFKNALSHDIVLLWDVAPYYALTLTHNLPAPKMTPVTRPPQSDASATCPPNEAMTCGSSRP